MMKEDATPETEEKKEVKNSDAIIQTPSGLLIDFVAEREDLHPPPQQNYKVLFDRLLEHLNNNFDIDDDELITLKKLFKILAKHSGSMASSFTYSFSFPFIIYFIGRLKDKNAVAAIPFIATLLSVTVTMGTAPSFSISTLASEKRGEIKRLEQQPSLQVHQQQITQLKRQISKLPRHGAILSIPFLMVAITIMACSDSILVAFGQDKEIAAITQSYLWCSALLVPSMLARNSFEQILFPYGKNTLAVSVCLVNFIIGTACSYVFSGPMAMGVPGIAWGFVIENYLTSISFGLILAKNSTFNDFNFFTSQEYDAEVDPQQIKALAKIGYPTMLTLTGELLAPSVISIFAGWLGSDELILMGFFSQTSYIPIILSIAGGISTCQLFNYCKGKRNFPSASRVSRYGILIGNILNSPYFIVMLIILLANPQLLGLLLGEQIDDYVLTKVKVVVPIAMFSVVLDSLGYGMRQILSATDFNKTSTALSAGSVWLGVGAAYYWGVKQKGGIYDVMWGYTLGLLARVITLGVPWFSRTKVDTLQSGQRSSVTTSCASVLNSISSGFSSLFSRCRRKPVSETALLLSEHISAEFN